jgi:hypothetical protein
MALRVAAYTVRAESAEDHLGVTDHEPMLLGCGQGEETKVQVDIFDPAAARAHQMVVIIDIRVESGGSVPRSICWIGPKAAKLCSVSYTVFKEMVGIRPLAMP